MSAAAEWVLLIVLLPVRRRAGRLADRLRERDEIVVRGWWRAVFALVPDQVPAARRGQPAGV